LAGTLDIAALGAVAIDKSVSPPRIYVADTHNNRVLRFDDAYAFASGAAASVVIGQQNFTTRTSLASNRDRKSPRLHSSPTPLSLILPYTTLFRSSLRALSISQL